MHDSVVDATASAAKARRDARRHDAITNRLRRRNTHLMQQHAKDQAAIEHLRGELDGLHQQMRALAVMAA